MAEAVTLASLHGQSAVDAALGLAAMAGRFGAGDLDSILVHGAGAVAGAVVPPAEHSLAQGTQCGRPSVRRASLERRGPGG